MHFPPVPQCDVKVLLLIFSPKKRAFVGLIPVEQVCARSVPLMCMSHTLKTVWCASIRCGITFISLSV